MVVEDVYNIDETGLFIVPNQNIEQGKVRGCKIQKDHLTLALAVNMACT